MRTLQVNPTRMQAALSSDMLATDLADYLVRQGTPFRQAHHLVGQAVRLAEALGLTLSTLPLAELQAISPHLARDVAHVMGFHSFGGASAPRPAAPPPPRSRHSYARRGRFWQTADLAV